MQATARHHLIPLQYFEGVVWVLSQPALQKIVEYFSFKNSCYFLPVRVSFVFDFR